MNLKFLPLDSETKVLESPLEHKNELRLWLRMLTCTNLIESQIRKRLSGQFATTLPRFDLLAQLERAPDGMTMSDLSGRMMVTNGNITGLMDRLAGSGDVERFALPDDRRVQIVKLTNKGRANFARMSQAHEAWMAEFFSQLTAKEIKDLTEALGQLKNSIRSGSGMW